MPFASCVSHITAGLVHEFPLAAHRVEVSPIHVTAKSDAARRQRGGVKVHPLPRDLRRTMVVEGLRVTHPIDTWCALSAILTLDELVAIGDHLVRRQGPDATMEETSFEDYMALGPLEACDVAREITGTDAVNVMGYCIGGTLLAMTLGWLTAKRDKRFHSASFMVSLLDFSRVGDTAVFLGEPGIDFVEQQMMQRGYLDSREMSNMFNLLRSNDLI